MDWSKAKNIIIAVLLAANVIMGVNLAAQRGQERARAKQAVQDTGAFLEQAGLVLQTEIPERTEKLPVVFLRLQKTEEAAEDMEYRGIPIVVQGGSVGFEVSGSGQQSAEIIPASEALLKLYARICREGRVEGRTIESIDLVYLLSPEDSSYAAQDTAVPAWRVVVSGYTYYVNAYED